MIHYVYLGWLYLAKWVFKKTRDFAMNGLQRIFSLIISNSSLKTQISKYSVHFEDFLAANAAVWREKDESKQTNGSDQYILVEGLLDHPGYLTLQALITRYIMEEETNLSAIALLQDRCETKTKRLFDSYGIKDFYFLNNSKISWRKSVRNAFIALKLLINSRTGEELLSVKFEGINFGRFVYDTYMYKTGEGTINYISFDIFDLMISALDYYEHCKNLFSCRRFRFLVLAETNYIKWGVLACVALKYGTVIYSREGGPARISVRRYDDLNQIHTYPCRPSFTEFETVYNNYRKQAVAVADAYLEWRFSGKVTVDNDNDAALAFASDRRTFSKEDICRSYGWSPKKPIVCILSHVLIDAVHSNNWSLFRDYLIWLRETLLATRQITHINWLIKPHPTERYYKSKQTAKSEFQAFAADYPHVRFFPNNASNATLLNISHAIITVCGTAGIEYSCCGIPCILAGEAPYSGFGFTIEPKSKKEYFNLLQNIQKLEYLTPSQIEKAKVIAHIYFKLICMESIFFPKYSVHADINEDDFFKKSAYAARHYQPHEDKLYHALRRQIRQKEIHSMNPDLIDNDFILKSKERSLKPLTV